MSELIFLDGQWLPAAQARVALDGDAMLRGFSLYTTLRTAGLHPVLFAGHVRRLRAQCAELGWPPPPSAARLRQLIAEGVARSGGGEQIVRVMLWQMPDGPHRALFFSPLSARPFVRLWPAPPGSARPLAEIKFGGHAATVYWEIAARRQGADEALLQRESGSVTETSRSNLLWVDLDGAICVTDGAALAGVTLDWALARLRAAGFAPFSRALGPARIAAIESARAAAAMNSPPGGLQSLTPEILVTSGVKGVVPATLAAGDAPKPPLGKMGKYLQEQYLELVEFTATGAADAAV
jgi:D-alanine transaminase